MRSKGRSTKTMLPDTKPTKLKSLPNLIDFSEILVPKPYLKNASTTSPQPIKDPQQYHQTCEMGHSLDSVTYTKLVQSSASSGSFISGKLAHAHMIKTAFKLCTFLQNNLMNMYWKCGDIDSARLMFDQMPKRNVVSWNSMISGYNQMGLHDKAKKLFSEARMAIKLDKFTYASMLSMCSQTGDLEFGKKIHGLIAVDGLGAQVFLTNSFIDMYSKCGWVDQARLVFDNSDELDYVSWNSLIAGYVQSGRNNEMLRVLVKMHRYGMAFNSYVLGSVLKACCSNFGCSVECGKMLHGCAVKLGWDMDVVVGTALLDMYAKSVLQLSVSSSIVAIIINCCEVAEFVFVSLVLDHHQLL
ncbi:unnamed protein product [Ilex paraguariensis]|uniref:Pentatricopeptide repeat-containing protein n=1 Tax=Ilex paraguariensis TaxID=185542 RepID=A0ABC8V2A5_9AQUA